MLFRSSRPTSLQSLRTPLSPLVLSFPDNGHASVHGALTSLLRMGKTGSVSAVSSPPPSTTPRTYPLRSMYHPTQPRHRYVRVWNDVGRVYDEMVAKEGWTTKATVDIPSADPFTNKVASLPNGCVSAVSLTTTPVVRSHRRLVQRVRPPRTMGLQGKGPRRDVLWRGPPHHDAQHCLATRLAILGVPSPSQEVRESHVVSVTLH